MVQPIQTRLKIIFSSTDITENIMPDLLSFTYDDKEKDEADEISLTLKDETGKWASRWKPDGGETIRAYIIPGTTTLKYKRLPCGKFYVDSLRESGSSDSPRVFEIRAVSIPLNKPLRRKIKSRAWEKMTLKSIVQKIAAEAGLKYLFDSQENPTYDRQEQSRESDLKFLSRLCEEIGLSIKITDDKLVVFDQSYYESKAAKKTFVLGVSNILSWDFESSQSETYKSVTVTYRDPKKKSKTSAGGYNMDLQKVKKEKVNAAVMTYTYTDPKADENGQEYAIKKRAKSIDEAKRLAKAKLRSLNARSVTGSMTIIGDVSMVAGIVVKCKGFGSFDGNFIVEQASHSVDSGGYRTTLTLRRVNNNY
nr:MAG TPA: 43 kDa tail protein [Caudoviricetes sp.]